MIQCDNLTIKIGSNNVCKQLNLHCQAGETWGVLGANGVGKTTLLKALAGIHPAHEGVLSLNQKSIESYSLMQLAKLRGYLSQHTETGFVSSLLEYVITGLLPHKQGWSWENNQDIALAQEALKLVELDSQQHKMTNQLSGGERQRLNLAKLYIQNPKIWILDEPNNHLDIRHQIKHLERLKRHSTENNYCIIMSLHDMNLASRFCSHVLLLIGEGDWLAGKTQDLLNRENLTRLYGYPIKQIENRFFPE